LLKRSCEVTEKENAEKKVQKRLRGLGTNVGKVKKKGKGIDS